jgi:hypothetical protein
MSPCARCGQPATNRMGFDLVDPDSGIPACDDCVRYVRMADWAAMAGDLDVAEDLMRKPARRSMPNGRES